MIELRRARRPIRQNPARRPTARCGASLPGYAWEAYRDSARAAAALGRDVGHRSFCGSSRPRARARAPLHMRKSTSCMPSKNG
jgi:hypothetical protein